MNILLWALQIFLGVHTAVGAVWKLSNSQQAVPSLGAIPHGVWVGLSVVDLLAAVALILPAFHRSLGVLAPSAAVYVAAEMLVFCAVHLASGETNHSPVVYWLVVAAVCGFIAYGRFVLKPH
jgi:hypothetical protein